MMNPQPCLLGGHNLLLLYFLNYILQTPCRGRRTGQKFMYYLSTENPEYWHLSKFPYTVCSRRWQYLGHSGLQTANALTEIQQMDLGGLKFGQRQHQTILCTNSSPGMSTKLISLFFKKMYLFLLGYALRVGFVPQIFNCNTGNIRFISRKKI